MRPLFINLALFLSLVASGRALGFCTSSEFAGRLHVLLAQAQPRLSDQFPEIQSLELPETASDAISAHSISLLSAQYRQGRGLAIGVGPGPGDQHALFLGEYIQSAFVIKTLKQAFPEATIVHGDFTGEWKARHLGLKTIHLEVIDEAELGIQKNGFTGSSEKKALDMPVLKAANPTLQSLREFDARSVLGIRPDELSMSLYVVKGRSGSARDFPDVTAVLEQSVEAGHAPSVAFISYGGTPSDYASKPLLAFAERNHYEVIKLSDITRPLDPQKKYIILNDTTGRLPYLDRASNVSIRVGPINIFESLAVGTPTIYFQNREVLGGYVPHVFEKMSAIAQKTGGAYPVKSMSDYSNTLTKALASPVRPALPDAGPFEEYLDQLTGILRRNLAAIQR